MAYPEALFQFVIGRYLPLQPVSWLRFSLFICRSGTNYPESEYWAMPGEEGYSETLTDQYKERISKL